ncbi:TRAF3-interacting protein 1-like [Argonauta hians]
MDTKMFKRTRDTLGKIIARPPLTDKLLAKPPFRFLHDIITSVIKSTGFMQGLYTDEEHNSDNVKDKESKMKFLQKAIDMVSLVTEKQLSVRPSKIVAGHEPEKSNEFLQLLAEAIKKQVENEVYVQRVLKGDHASTKRESSKEKEKSKEKTKEKIGSKQAESEEQYKSKEKGSKEHNSKSEKYKNQSENETKSDERERRSKSEGKEKHRSKNEHKSKSKSEEKESQQNRIEEKEKQRNKHEEKEKRQPKDEEKQPKEKSPTDKEKSSRKSMKDDTKENEKPPQENNDKRSEDITLRKLTRPTSAKGSRQKNEEKEVSLLSSDTQPPLTGKGADKGADSQTTKLSSRIPEHSSSARVGSARRAPPKLRTSEVIDDPMIQLGKGKPTNVITDDGTLTDEEEQFVVEDETLLPYKDVTSKTDETGDTEDGGLVNKLLETKKELEGAVSSEEKSNAKVENSIMNSTTYQRQKELTENKIAKLQASIQGLTKSANPLGKIMDYIQEDLDSMHKELNQWKGEKLEYRLALKEEREITEKALQPLKLQLTTLDQAIKDQLDIIATIKANIIRNDRRIKSMLHSVVKL